MQIKNQDLRYPDMDIEFFPYDPNLYDPGLTPHGLGYKGEWHIKLKDAVIEGWRVNRYPWHLLERLDTYIVMENCNAKVARVKAYLYAKRRGWRVAARVPKDGRTLWAWRYGSVVPVGEGLYDAPTTQPEPIERPDDEPKEEAI